MSFKQFQKTSKDGLINPVQSNRSEYNAMSCKYCLSCGFQLPVEAVFCSQCGRNQTEITQDPGAQQVVVDIREGYQAPPVNANPVIVIKPVAVKPTRKLHRGIHQCQQAFCGVNTTLECQSCHAWICQRHLTTVKGSCGSYPMLCGACLSARNRRQCAYLMVLLVILAFVVFVINVE